MRAVRIHQPGDHTALVVEEAPLPPLATGDVLVEVRAAGLVPDELSWPGTWVDRAGRDRTPSVPAHEVAGVIIQVRYGTTGFDLGDRVFGLTDWHRDGAAADYVAVEARNLARMPSSADFVQAAALPIAGLTAWQGLFVHGRLQSGQTVVVHGAGGGTGAVAVQLAVDAGAQVIGTGRTNAAAVALGFGAAQFVDLDHERFDDAEVGQVDLIFDTIGGELLERSAARVRSGGTLVSITSPPPVKPVGGRALFFIVEPDRSQLQELAHRVDGGRLRPHVGATYSIPAAPQAFAAKRRGLLGKAVLTA